MTAQSYCTTATIKARIGITNSTDDTPIGVIASEVNGWLESKLTFPVGPISSEERLFDGNAVRCRDGFYVIPCYPFGVRAISAVRTATETGGSYTAQTASDVVIRPHSWERETDWPGFEMWIKDSASWTWTTSGLDVNGVTATWGWAAIPDELSSIAIRLGVARWRRRSAGSAQYATSEDVMGEVAAEEMAVSDWATINKYRDLRKRIV